MANVEEPETDSVEAHNGRIRVTKTVDELMDKEEVEEIEVRAFEGPVAKVSTSYGMTLNMGDYQSARVDVHLSLPCYMEEIDEVYQYSRQWTEKRAEEEIDKLVELRRSEN